MKCKNILHVFSKTFFYIMQNCENYKENLKLLVINIGT